MVSLPPPIRGDGPDQRHVDFVSTELIGYFDEIFADDEYIQALELNEEEKALAWMDRGVVDLAQYFDAKRMASGDDANNLTYETMKGIVSRLVYRLCQYY